MNCSQGKSQNKFWVNFQSYLDNAVPDFIVKTLICAGFDNGIALSELDEDDIFLIEKYAAEKCTHLIELDKENGTFKFKPGHRKLLLGLPKKVNKFLEEKQSKKLLTQQKPIHNLNLEEIELLSEQELNELKSSLIVKLNKTLKSLGSSKLFTQTEIGQIDTYISYSNSATRKPSYKCLVKCVYCEKLVPCTHISHWQTSNLDGHIRKEVKSETSAAESNSENSHAQQVLEPVSQQLNNNLDKPISNSSEKIVLLQNISTSISVDSELNAMLKLNKK